MRRTPAIVLTALLVLLALAVACGDDGSTPGENNGGGENPNGPAADVQGVWQGTYASDAGTRTGSMCMALEQDNRELTGTVTFEGEPLLQIGGTIANNRMAIVWSPQTGGAGSVTPADSASIQFITGGTLTGDVAEEAFGGTWTAIDTDRGTWSATRSDAPSC